MSTAERKNAGEAALQRALLRLDNTLPDRAIEFLVDAGHDTIEFQSYVAGEALDIRSLVEAVQRSDAGQLVFAAKQEDTSATQDHVQNTAMMTPQQRINYARKHGLS